NASTPIQLLRYVAGLGNGGFINKPHPFFKAVAGGDRRGNQRHEDGEKEGSRGPGPSRPGGHQDVTKRDEGAETDRGGAREAGGGRGGAGEGGWGERAGKNRRVAAGFISFAPRNKPEIGAFFLPENAGFGGRESAPRAKAIYEDYYRRTRGITDKPEETKAENSGPGDATQSPESKTGVRAPEPKPQTPDSRAKGQR